jgi:hypothetical protein
MQRTRGGSDRFLTKSSEKPFVVTSDPETMQFASHRPAAEEGNAQHVSPDSPESQMLATMDATSLIMARRCLTKLPLLLGPVTVSITLMQCPTDVFHSMLQPKEPAVLRPRHKGTIPDTTVILIGPLSKGSISKEIANSCLRMAELRMHMQAMCQVEMQTTDMRLVTGGSKGQGPLSNVPVH